MVMIRKIINWFRKDSYILFTDALKRRNQEYFRAVSMWEVYYREIESDLCLDCKKARKRLLLLAETKQKGVNADIPQDIFELARNDVEHGIIKSDKGSN